MDKEKEKKLLEEFPDIFRDYYKSIHESCMPWGICCGNGWYDLIYDLCRNITTLTRDKNIYVVADQVKEKFGGLRFYYHTEGKRNSRFWYSIRTFFYSHRWGRQYNYIIKLRMKFFMTTEEKIEEFVREAEIKSVETCEVCGQPGTTRGGGWVRTLCKKCEKDEIDQK
jgi:hypothetical protein